MRYSLYCSCCSARGINKYPHRQHKKSQCEQCRFIPIHPCQLDVDHIDGNKNNNNINNYITLCANCHRLKTFLNKDWDKRNVI